MGLYWNSVIEDEYFSRNPRGLNPVLINDVVFSIHAMVATSVTIWQCFIYEVDIIIIFFLNYLFCYF